MRDLHGKHAIVTGSSRGIGLEIAKVLASEGVSLAMNARDGARLGKAAEGVRAIGTQVITVSGDIRSPSVRAELVRTATRAFETIDLLINNVGFEPMAEFSTQREEEIVSTIEINLIAPLLLARQLIPAMVSRGHGYIVAVSSGTGLMGQPFAATYSATKAAEVKWAEALRAELAGSGVGVSVVCPGMVTGAGIVKAFQDATGIQPPRITTVSAEQVAQAVLKAIRTDAGMIIVQPGPMRLLLALGLLFPGVGDGIARSMGVYAYMKQLADWRAHGTR
jgi:short-subunit dehydrogenase